MPDEPSFHITVKTKHGSDNSISFHDILVQDDETPHGVHPHTVNELKHSLGCILDRTYDWDLAENEEKMRPWYDAADALDEEAFFPVHIGPTPDGVTILVERNTDG